MSVCKGQSPINIPIAARPQKASSEYIVFNQPSSAYLKEKNSLLGLISLSFHCLIRILTRMNPYVRLFVGWSVGRLHGCIVFWSLRLP